MNHRNELVDCRVADNGCEGGSGSDRFEWEAAFDGDVAGSLTLRVDHGVPGPVRVIGWEKPSVTVSGRKQVRGLHGSDAERVLRETEIDVMLEGSELRVTTDTPRSVFGWSSPRVRVELTVRVPQGTEVAVDSSSGPVGVEDTEGPVSISAGSGSVEVATAVGRVSIDAGSGSVTVAKVRGDVDLDLGSGSVELRRISGDVEVDGTSGSVRAAEIEGRLNVDTASGSVVLDRIIGDVSIDTGSGGVRLGAVNGRRISVDTGSGSIDADFEVHQGGRYHFDTGSGSIALTVPDDASFTLDAETGSGGIDCLLPLTVTHSTRHRLAGRLGDGSARIEADTSSGRLRVRGRHGRRQAESERASRPAGVDEHQAAVLRMVEEGKITADQGAALLKALGVDATEQATPASVGGGAELDLAEAGDGPDEADSSSALAEIESNDAESDPADSEFKAGSGPRGSDLTGIW